MLSSIAGKTFWLDRKIRLWTRSQLGAQLAIHGGTTRDAIAAGVDYVVLDPARWNGVPLPAPREQAETLGIAVLTLDHLYALLCPDRDEALALLRGGSGNRERWESLLPLACSTAEIDLAEADLSALDLAGFTFRRCDLSGANLSGATLQGATLVGLCGVDLTKAASLREVQISSAVACNLDRMDLRDAQLSGRFERCTFRHTNLSGVEGSSVEWIDCIATGADLSRGDFTGLIAERLNAPQLQALGTVLDRARFDHAQLNEASFAQAILEEARFVGTQLEEADFRQANLTQADLTGANVQAASFHEANLNQADFTEARTDGASFVACQLRGTILEPVQGTALPRIDAVAAPKYPPALLELHQALSELPNWALSFVVVHPTRGPLAWVIESAGRGRFRVACQEHAEATVQPSNDWLRSLADLAHPEQDYHLQADTVRLLPHPVADAQPLLHYRALCELFHIGMYHGEPPPRSLFTALGQGVTAFFREEESALGLWQSSTHGVRRGLVNLRGADLSGTALAGIDLFEWDLRGANLEHSDLTGAVFQGANLERARLADATLTNARLHLARCQDVVAHGVNLHAANLAESDWSGADLANADLSQATLDQARFLGADLTGANLNGVNTRFTLYDEATRFPENYTPVKGWISTSGELAFVPASVADLPGFLAGIFPHNSFSGRLRLHASRVQPVWASIDEDHIEGVLPALQNGTASQACRLTSTGRHQCASSDLVPCTPTGTGVCAHVVALVLWLAKEDRLSPETAARWMQRSLAHPCDIDRDVIMAILARYAETTQADYRPNETLPEDYYAL